MSRNLENRRRLLKELVDGKNVLRELLETASGWPCVLDGEMNLGPIAGFTCEKQAKQVIELNETPEEGIEIIVIRGAPMIYDKCTVDIADFILEKRPGQSVVMELYNRLDDGEDMFAALIMGKKLSEKYIRALVSGMIRDH